VLLRLQDARGEFISPDAFLPTAERFNMMPLIDKWVIKNAMRRLAEHNAQGHTYTFSINLSGQSLEDKQIVDFIRNTLDEHRLDPASIIFEITETSAIANFDAANRLINELREIGCRFALDDFGSGFSSFSHLKFLSTDFIKIDGIFIRSILHDPIDRAIVSSIVQIAHSLGKQTVAEYVDNVEVLKVLAQAGIDNVQGFYICRPHAAFQNPPEVRRNTPVSSIL
jgi:EAL domain-containing protein (putative c-di-GMP-specific phosphodiesterase class I)